MSFRDREKERLVPLKAKLFSKKACAPGVYKGKTYDFCLHQEYSIENLHESIGKQACTYFSDRRIGWHDGISLHDLDAPSNHLCCSQSAAVNTWFPFEQAPNKLKDVLNQFGYKVKQILPLCDDYPAVEGVDPHVGFEWIGLHNYLGELKLGKVAKCWERTRGANFTSADFIFRFLRDDGKKQIVLGEWKYTEEYTEGKSIRIAKSGQDRLEIYGPHLRLKDSPIRKDIKYDDLFYDPFDQLMRLQLLAKAVERNHEMGADVVSVMHVMPRANTDLANQITSPKLSPFGKTIHDVWTALLVNKNSFRGVYFEDLLAIVTRHAPTSAWAEWMNLRYGGMK